MMNEPLFWNSGETKNAADVLVRLRSMQSASDSPGRRFAGSLHMVISAVQ